jgi:glycosyltransferase involved in cell wall biosynthesis
LNFHSIGSNISRIFHKGFPNEVSEGMACGKPIIFSDVSDLSLIIVEGENGFLCKANDIKYISSAIQRLISTSKYKLEKMSKNNRKKATEIFNPDIVTTNYLNLLTNEK